MKPLLTAIAAAIFLLLPALAFAGYVIHLKDGTQFVTDQYFEEGDQIKFKRYGGLVGIEKDRILGIEETEAPPESSEKMEMPPETAEIPVKDKELGVGGGEVAQPVESGREGIESPVKKGKGTEDKRREGEDPGVKKKGPSDKNIDIERYTREKIALLEKKRMALEKYRMARDSRDDALMREAKQQYKDTNTQLSELAFAVRKENGGTLPPWWHEVKLEAE